jgi:hypothetical protein
MARYFMEVQMAHGQSIAQAAPVQMAHGQSIAQAAPWLFKLVCKRFANRRTITDVVGFWYPCAFSIGALAEYLQL